MSMLGELLREMPSPPLGNEKTRSPRRVEKNAPSAPPLTPSIREEQIHHLVQRLFLLGESAPVRRVGFTPIEASAQTARLCLDAAKALAGDGRYEIGLIDASIGGAALPALLQIPTPTGAPAPCAIAPRLWLAPRDSWCPLDGQHPASDQNLERLRELTTEFDFSIVYCPPVSWLTARIAQHCDGLVLVLTANRTRRLVAAHIKDQLRQSGIPLLGTVLAERRFPVPGGLYRSL
jgi:Mrp family chromosome partitioning ATPase